MSKPLATKVSTPLSENVQIGPNKQFFGLGVAAILDWKLLKVARRCERAIGQNANSVLQ